MGSEMCIRDSLILDHNTGFCKRGMDFLLGIGAGRIKNFVSAPNLRNNVPFLHLLLAIDNYYTPYKFGFRKPNRWGPRVEKAILGFFGAPSGRFFGYSPGTPTFRFSDSNFVWRMAVVSSFQYVKKWDNILKSWRGYEDFIPPGAIPNKKSIPHL